MGSREINLGGDPEVREGEAVNVRASDPGNARPSDAGAVRGAGEAPDFDLPAAPIELGVMWGGIDEIDQIESMSCEVGEAGDDPPPVDALAVGHYIGTTRLSTAERALDFALSRALLGLPSDVHVRGPDRILTSYSRRDVINGELGRVFVLPDPRSPGRVVAIAGMGLPGRFGVSELTFLTRELSWNLGRMGKRHLATPLIGSGDGNLELNYAATGWVRGLRLALVQMEQDPRFRLRRITFVTPSARQVARIHKLLCRLQSSESRRDKSRLRLDIRVKPASLDGLRNVAGMTLNDALMQSDHGSGGRRFTRPRSAPIRDDKPPPDHPTPARISVLRSGKRLLFGAITENAAIPEREIPLDPTLITEANDRLPHFDSTVRQVGWGSYMGQLLFPRELQWHLSLNEPLVMILDVDTAQIHWEMLAQTDQFHSGEVPRITFESGMSEPLTMPIGIARGLTRQLRTTFAPPPEAPPPPVRLLRVLVVADPADDLPAARAEGKAVAEIFAAHNHLGKYRVEVVSLIGSKEATRNDVLYHLTQLGPYDILHYAGHCAFEKGDPEASGWVFANHARLSVHELNRIDRIPRFVFSNACESGALPEGASDGRFALAPSFALAFFGRGVSNFVCAAWAVDDDAARVFALELYAGLLGLARAEGAPGGEWELSAGGPRPMYEAMRKAREKIFIGGSADVRTWGAYQHYGDPYYRLFEGALPADEKKK